MPYLNVEREPCEFKEKRDVLWHRQVVSAAAAECAEHLHDRCPTQVANGVLVVVGVALKSPRHSVKG